MKATKVLLLLATILVIATGCEDKPLTGQLNVSMYPVPSEEVTLTISPIENPSIPILTNLATDSRGNLSVELNHGNYIVNCHAPGMSFNSVGFQIRPNKTTKVHYNDGRGAVE